MLRIHLGQVSCHLQGAVHRDVASQLIADRRVDVGVVLRIVLADIHLEDTRRVVHRTTDEAGEGQYSEVVRLVTTEGLILLTTCRLLRDEVRIGTAETRHVDGLVSIDGDLMLSSLLDSVEVVVHHALTVVVLTAGDDVAYVAALDSGVAVVSHELVRLLHVPLIVRDRAGGLVVHDDLHALALSVVTELSDVEVGVRGDEVKDTILTVAEPVFPTDIPAFDQDGIEAVLSGEVDVLLDVLGVGSVLAIRLHLRVVGLTDLHVGQVVGVRPRALARDHLPPDPYILNRLDPVGGLIGAGFIEVISKLRS